MLAMAYLVGMKALKPTQVAVTTLGIIGSLMTLGRQYKAWNSCMGWSLHWVIWAKHGLMNFVYYTWIPRT